MARTSRGLTGRSRWSVGTTLRSTATGGRRRKGSSRVTTKGRLHAISPPMATACRPRPSGNMPAAPARPPTTASARTTASSGSTRGLPATPTNRRTRWARRSRMPGACTTCTATWPNGATTFSTRTTTRMERRATPAARRMARGGYCGVGRGTRGPTTAVRPPAWARAPAPRTPASPATPSASAACGGRSRTAEK